MRVSVRIDGGPRVAAALRQLSHRVSRQVQLEALRQAAVPMAEVAEEAAPYDPNIWGHLREEMMIRRAVYERDAAVAMGPWKKTFWGGFQEWGTAYHEAQPFMRPAFDQTVQQSFKIILGYLADVLIRKGTSFSGRGSGGSLAETIPVETE
jgi:HK97 gp10 family phage protein